MDLVPPLKLWGATEAVHQIYKQHILLLLVLGGQGAQH